MASNDPNKKKEIDQFSGVETTGHEWDGLKELNNPAPRWWLWVFFVSVVFAVGYWFVYPAWPTLMGHTAGSKNWSEYGQLKDQQNEIQAMRAKYETRFNSASLQDIQNDRDLYQYAIAGGAVAFKNNCAACHGAGAQGGKGYPNLNDDDWIWGGTLDQIYTTIRYGAHNDNPQTHQGGMLAWKDMLKSDEIEAVATYVGNLYKGDKADKTPAYIAGQAVFANNCVACHGDKGQGNIDVGAKQLNNNIWLYGGDHATIVQTITYGRSGVMPAWEGRLSDSTIKQLAVYVHSLGGGR
ncbi:MAG: cytochrome-c oxidase, cbb3-type subunit III [Alphaproteobacteria bacterium]